LRETNGRMRRSKSRRREEAQYMRMGKKEINRIVLKDE
jgi:hypothetical protein